ncbi:PaaI family thioesterase [Planktotalea sp.]|uniref:PaaI family thioesterase n=1 Tax=Planktotalea sp. TaxID=2029877 RepID=UPI003297CD9C
MELKMDAAALNTLMRQEFSQVAEDFVVEEVAPMAVTVRLPVAERHLRPGGTISGPTMFSLADVSMYLATMAMIGPVTLAVTTNCSINFMRKPKAGVDLIAYAKLHKLGKLLSVGDVLIHSEGLDAPVAQASLTYAIPPR